MEGGGGVHKGFNLSLTYIKCYSLIVSVYNGEDIIKLRVSSQLNNLSTRNETAIVAVYLKWIVLYQNKGRQRPSRQHHRDGVLGTVF